MDKEELKKAIKSYQNQIAPVGIVMNHLSAAEYVIGYGFDETKKQWKVYRNGERGMPLMSKYFFGSEEEALKMLYEAVLDYYKFRELLKERDRKDAQKSAETQK